MYICNNKFVYFYKNFIGFWYHTDKFNTFIYLGWMVILIQKG